MKQLCGTSRNLAAIEDDGKLVPYVEVVLDVIEGGLEFDAGGQPQRVSRIEDQRFWTSPKSLRDLAERLEKWACEAEAFVAKSYAGDPS